jgi:hypothetical protein
VAVTAKAGLLASIRPPTRRSACSTAGNFLLESAHDQVAELILSPALPPLGRLTPRYPRAGRR